MAKFGRHPWLMMGEAVNLRAGDDRTMATARYDELAARARTDYVQPAVLSMVAASIGRADEAAHWFERAIDTHDSLILGFNAQFPAFATILLRPDVQSILRRVNWDPPVRH